MKYRKDFVTNSSSSSYICEICGANEFGYDLSLEDACMCECVNGHTFCCEHLLEVEEYEAKESDNYYDVPEKHCPICQFIEYSEADLSAYLLKGYGVPRDEVFAEVKKFNKRRKKLYDGEYITYVCQKFNLTPAEIVSGWKEKFWTYENFSKNIK